MRFRILGQYLFWICLLLSGSNALAQTLIFNEQFNEGDGATSGVDLFGNGWDADCSGCTGTFQVQGGELVQNQSRIVTLFSTDDISIDGCNTISFEMNYSGTAFDPGSGPFLDSASKCGCAGDVNAPYAAGCDNCWDFMLVELVFEDGSREEVELIGTTFLPTTAFIQHTSQCVGSNSTVSIEITSQTWGSPEFMRIDNVRLFCNAPEVDNIEITQSPNGTFCEGDVVELAVNNAPGESFEWFDPNGNPIVGSNNSISFAASDFFGFGIQTFSVISTDAMGCRSSDSRNILVNQAPNAVLPNDMTVCEGGDVTLQETASDATGWMWVGPASGAPSTDTWVINNATLANSGTYTVSVTDGSSCFGTASVNITVESSGSFNLTTFGNVCENDAPLILSTTQDGVNGNWSGFGVTSNVFDPASVTSGNYNLTFTPNSAGCLIPQETPISVIASPTADPPISPLEACGSGSAIFNLSTQDAVINGGTSLIVTWYEDADLLIPIADPANFDSPSATVYAVMTENGCTSDIQPLDLLLSPGPQIMMPADLEGCGSVTLSPINIVGGSGTEAYYSEPGGNGTLIPVGSSYNQDTVVYAYDSNASCSSEQAIKITVGSTTSAGPDVNLAICESGFINLLDLVDSSADAGNFEDGGGNLIVGNMILADDFAGSSLQLVYRTDPVGSCPSETAFYDIQVKLENQAGLDRVERVCFGKEYDLADFTFDQGMSGTFEMLDGTPILDTRVSSNDLSPVMEALYIVSTSKQCDPDTANIELLGESPPSRAVIGSVCSNYSTTVNGVDFNFANPSDTLVFASGSFCDSIVFIDLQFRPENRMLLNTTLCTGQELMINGTIYGMGNPVGTEVVFNGDQFGCDSIIDIDLTFDTEVTTLLDFDLCSGQDTLINGFTYNASSSTGSTTLTSTNGCDSIVMIDLNILQASDSLITGFFCATDSLLIEGEVFDLNRPNGLFLSQFANAAGCDSLIIVDLEFDASRSLLIDSSLCSDKTININGTVYGAANPVGMELVSVANGCDSLYSIDLSILQSDTLYLSSTFCRDTFIVVNNVVYDRLRSKGEEVIQGGAASGCNQYVFVDLEYIESFEEYISMDLCFGDSIVVNGVVYGEANPSGLETFQTANGCDSIINIDLAFSGVEVDFQKGMIDCEKGVGSLIIDIQQGESLVEDIILDGVSIIDQYQVNGVIENIPPGDREVDIFSSDGCSILYTFSIDEVGGGNVSIASSNVSDDYYQLEAVFSGVVSSLLWSPSEGLSCTDCIAPEARPPSNISYTVQITDASGCSYSSSIELRFLATSVIYQPNIFSPNEDGFNDVFYLESEGEFDFANFSIYDRWGNQVFQKMDGKTGDPSLGWDGHGHEEGVYVYYVELEFPDGFQTLSGEISLLR